MSNAFRFPHLEHRAVIVAEDITNRFFNVISILNRAVPIIAVQMSAVKIGERFTLACESAWGLTTQGDDSENSISPRRDATHLAIRIGITPNEFRHFEPVEFDVSVRYKGKSKAGGTIPDMLDPGYECFQIWLESENGERRRYRPSRRYCTNPAEIRVATGAPLHRDIKYLRRIGGVRSTVGAGTKCGLNSICRTGPSRDNGAPPYGHTNCREQLLLTGGDNGLFTPAAWARDAI